MILPPVFRLFLSSPGDVAIERRRIANLVSRLNGECAGRARIDTIRWETSSYQAFSTFQAQIPQATECDLVLTIFRWRLGTELPADFPDRMPDGAPYPSGTAFELLTSMEQRRNGGASPDVFVFRYGGSAPVAAIDDPGRERTEREWRRLNAFFEEHFLSAEGHFKAAFQLYETEDDLDQQIGALLRRWLEEKIAAGRILLWPDAIKGSPFPGLEAYGQRHASVFFGRDRDIARATERWRDAASRGAPFLLVVGGSGAGKSSLVRAGLVPRLTTAGVVDAVDGWRVATLRPADSPFGPLASLADGLSADRAADDAPAALPELATIVDGGLASLPFRLETDPAGIAATIVEILERLGISVQDDERRARPIRTDLVLVVDQLDELFGPRLDEPVRDAFVAALGALVRTGRVWVTATLRADLYGAMLEVPGLKELKDAGATYDLAPPGSAELAEIVRRPAQAADLDFGSDPSTGRGVDELLLEEADRPDTLPLVQLALSRLYEERVQEGDRTVLSFDAYAALGGLTGIIDEVGERALGVVSAEVAAGLPRLVRGLAQLEGQGALSGTLTVKPLPLSGLGSAPDRALVDALVDARILTVTGEGEAGQIRLAHQRVLTDWTRVRDIVAGSADFYRVRAELDRQRRRWAENRRADLLLPRGLPLAEAENLLSRYGGEVDAETRAFVKASRARAGRAQAITGGAAIVFAVVAIVALVQYGIATTQTRLAERNFGVARDALKGVVQNIVQGLIDVAGIRTDALRTILSTVQRGSDELVGTAPDDVALLRSRAAMFDDFSKVYLAAGDAAASEASAERALEVSRRLVALRPDDAGLQADMAVPMTGLGDSKRFRGDLTGSLALYEGALALARAAEGRAPGDDAVRVRANLPLHRLGEVKFEAGDLQGSRASYAELAERARRDLAGDPASLDKRKVVVIALSDLAYVDLDLDDAASAARLYGEALGLARAVAADFPSNTSAQSGLSAVLADASGLDLKEGRVTDAREKLVEAVAIERELVRRDPRNQEARRSLAIALEKAGNGAYAASDWPGAAALYREQTGMFRDLVSGNPDDVRNAASLAIGLQDQASVDVQLGDRQAALVKTEEQVAIDRRVVERQPGSAQARRALALALRDLGDRKRAAGDGPTALGLYEEAVALARGLVDSAPDNPGPLRTLNEILEARGLLQYASKAVAALAETRAEQEAALRRLLVLRPADREARQLLASVLLRFGVDKAVAGDRASALTMLAEAAALRRDTVSGADDRAGQRSLAVTLEVETKIALILERPEIGAASARELVELRRRLAVGGRTDDQVALASALELLARTAVQPRPLLLEASDLLAAVPEAERTDAARSLQASIKDRLNKTAP